jgi:hypothetical protein
MSAQKERVLDWQSGADKTDEDVMEIFCHSKTVLCSVQVAMGLHLLPVIPGFFMENFEENTMDKAAYKHCC